MDGSLLESAVILIENYDDEFYLGGGTCHHQRFKNATITIQNGNNLVDSCDISDFTGAGLHIYNHHGRLRRRGRSKAARTSTTKLPSTEPLPPALQPASPASAGSGPSAASVAVAK